MWGSAPFLDQLRAEVWERYRLLRDEYGPDRVARPSIALLGALAEVAAPSREDADPAALRDAAHHAGETYEYLVRRWQDPRWREVVTVAIAVGLPGLASRRASDHRGRPRRSAAEYPAEFAPASAGTASRTSPA